MSKIVVLDYGSSNLRSVAKALETVAGRDHRISVTNDTASVLNADKIVFPGQGAIGQAMSHLKAQQLDETIRECILNKPFLGICLGLQMLLDYSEEDGGMAGLGILSGNVVRFASRVKDQQGYICKVPSMGWNQVFQAKPHALWQGIEDASRFYFVHSYFVQAKETSDIAASSDYICRYTSAMARDNIFATQFHPEKSQRAGLTLLRNFTQWDGQA